MLISIAAALRQHQHICALNIQQTTASHVSCGGGVVDLADHAGASHCQVPRSDGGGHADLGGHHIVVAIPDGTVDAQSSQPYRLSCTHVFVTEHASCRAQERHTVASQRRDQRNTTDPCISVGVVNLV